MQIKLSNQSKFRNGNSNRLNIIMRDRNLNVLDTILRSSSLSRTRQVNSWSTIGISQDFNVLQRSTSTLGFNFQ
ncbi:unnamed protein product [Ambrosiozyma monospora]|uniref:Unnamed protein product n=1 Tax=Ambrosiozyma monospora TaxID=43982 RepID=A0ACB5UBU5_AMBMO|nr:unnamed protein product [Ambrosiozyma monospora]